MKRRSHMKKILSIGLGLLFALIAASYTVAAAGNEGPPRKFHITGKVTAGDGSPIPDAEVVLLGNGPIRTLTDSDGNYSFELIRNGACTVVPRKEGMRFKPARTTLSISDDNREGVDFVTMQ
jgi:hypothetical protein